VLEHPAERNVIGEVKTYDDDVDAELGNDRESLLRADVDLDVRNDFDASIDRGDDRSNGFRGASAVRAGASCKAERQS
jgi:hypothetical protein